MEWQLAEIQQVTGGVLHGDPATRVRSLRSLERAGPESLSFVRGPRHMAAARASRAGALIVPAGHTWTCPVIEVADPDVALIQVLTVVSARQHAGLGGVHPSASVARSAEISVDAVVGAHAVIEREARIGRGASIGPGTVVGRRSEVGAGSILYANVSVYHDVHIGKRVIIHSGSVIGADGFGYLPRGGKHVKIPHVGGVVIEDDVELGALVTVDRGMMDDTIVRQGAKIDDHCHVAHNCDVGECVIMAGGSMLSGSVRVGKAAVLAGAVAVRDNLSIGAGARLGGGSRVLSDVPPGESVLGYPAYEAHVMLKAFSILPRLPALRQTLQRVVEHLGLEDEPGSSP